VRSGFPFAARCSERWRPRFDNSAFVVAEIYRLLRRYGIMTIAHDGRQRIASDPEHRRLPLEGSALARREQRANQRPLRSCRLGRARLANYLLTEHEKVLTGLTCFGRSVPKRYCAYGSHHQPEFHYTTLEWANPKRGFQHWRSDFVE